MRSFGPGNHIGIKHANHMGVLRNLNEVPVFLLQPLKRRVPVTDDQLDSARHVAQGVNDFVNHPEAASPEFLLTTMNVMGQPVARREIQVVRLILGSGRLIALSCR
jgi:hypothetical protein